MKLLNNETGKEVILQNRNDNRVFEDYNIFINIYDGSVDLLIKDSVNEIQNRYHYRTFEMFRLEWEDYEEPKEFWYIDEWECRIDSSPYKLNEDMAAFLEELGLKFNTEEEAKKAVEKMKAWTRLKDKGFKFTGYDLYSGSGVKDKTEGEFAISAECSDFVGNKDLDLLFGGEE